MRRLLLPINIDLNSSLVTSSQKDVTVENSSQPQPGESLKRVIDNYLSTPRTYTRKTKGRELDTHTTTQTNIS